MKAGYKFTRSGIIPEDWELSTIGAHVLSLEAGVSVNSENRPANPNEFGVLKTSSTTQNRFNPLENKVILKTELGRARISPLKDTIIVSRMNTPELVGAAGFVSKDYPNLFLPDRLWMVKIRSTAFSKWLYFILSTDSMKELIRNAATGTSGSMKNLSKPAFSNLPIPLPPFPEQQKIADILTTVDDHISETEALIEKTKVLKQGLMQQLLNKGIGHTEFKDTEIGRIPVEWEVVRVEDAYEILDSKRIPINESERNKRIGDVPYYGANGIVGFIDDYIFDEPLILLAEDGGNFEDFKNRPIAYLIEGKSWVNNHAHVLKPMTKFEFRWLFYVMQHKDVTTFIKGGTRSKLNQKDLRNILIPIPPRFEQSFISQTLTSVDDQIETYQAKLSSITRLKTGLMQQLLTGKIRVKV